MSARLVRAVVLVCAAGGLPSAARAQAHARLVAPVGFTVVARNDLTFGDLAPGMPSTISSRDGYRAALFEIVGPANTPVRIELILPVSLTSEEGTGVPLTFGAGDGFAETGAATARGTTFNPRLPLVATLGHDGHLFLHVGATAHPDRLQRGGAYHAQILVNLYNLGS